MITSIIIGRFIRFVVGFFTSLFLIEDPDDYKCDCENPNHCNKYCPPKEMYRKYHG